MMDTSNEYIKMCEKAVEIQMARSKMAGDVYSPKFSNKITWIVGFNIGFSDISERDLTWLPRQNQLQEMIEGQRRGRGIHDYDFSFASNGVDWFMTITAGFDKKVEVGRFTSMEQLWLAFVMKERYSKQWSGKDWVK